MARSKKMGTSIAARFTPSSGFDPTVMTSTSFATSGVSMFVSYSFSKIGGGGGKALGSSEGSLQILYERASSMEFSGKRISCWPIFHISWQLMHSVCIKSVVPYPSGHYLQSLVTGSRYSVVEHSLTI